MITAVEYTNEYIGMQALVGVGDDDDDDAL